MSNIFTNARNALWTQLDGDTALSAFFTQHGGTKYKLAAGERLPKRLAAADCPALIIVPSDAPVEWDSTCKQLLGYSCDIIGDMYTETIDDAEEFAYLVYKAAFRGFRTRFSTDYIRDFMITPFSFAGFNDDNMFFVEFDAKITFRLQDTVI